MLAGATCACGTFQGACGSRLHLLGQLVHSTEHVKFNLCLLQVAGPVADASQVCQHCLQRIRILHLHSFRSVKHLVQTHCTKEGLLDKQHRIEKSLATRGAKHAKVQQQAYLYSHNAILWAGGRG